MAKPFLKWAGGKKWLIPHIDNYLPENFNRYYEPFLGCGAMFFHLRPQDAFISDNNQKLIHTYLSLRNNHRRVINNLSEMQYSEDQYYAIRERFNNRRNGYILSSIDFIYLNRTCWNGLYRENRDGGFNVPIGRYVNPKICDEENLINVSNQLNEGDIEIMCCDYLEAIEGADEGDFIFFDPPYITGHRNNGFHSYNKKLFSWDDQVRLADVAREMTERGCFVMITNAAHDSLLDLYDGFEIMPMSRRSLIAGGCPRDERVEEIVIRNY